MQQFDLFNDNPGRPIHRSRPPPAFQFLALTKCARPCGEAGYARPETAVEFERRSGETPPPATVRRLKIEAAGDFFKGLTKPKIRLMGRWLERAGFKPGRHVRVTCVSPGVIELRFD